MLTLTIITPERALPAFQAEHVTLVTADGQIGIRAGHIPLVAQLKPGFVFARGKDADLVYAVRGGIGQVFKDDVTVLAEAVLAPEKISATTVQARLAELTAQPAADAATRAEIAWCRAQLNLPSGRKLSGDQMTSRAFEAVRGVQAPH